MIHRFVLSGLTNKETFIQKWSGTMTGVKLSEKAANVQIQTLKD